MNPLVSLAVGFGWFLLLVCFFFLSLLHSVSKEFISAYVLLTWEFWIMKIFSKVEDLLHLL